VSVWVGLVEVLENNTASAANRSMFKLVLIHPRRTTTVFNESPTTSLFLILAEINCQNKWNRTWSTNLVILPDLPNKVMESFVDVDPLFRRGLDELASKMLCEITTFYYNCMVNTRAGGWMCRRSGHTIYANLSLIFQVRLVRDDYNRKRILVLDAEDLLVECVDFLDRFTRGD